MIALPPIPFDRRLGRHQHFDEKSRAHPIRTELEAVPQVPRSYTWRCKDNLDQGDVGACVGFSIAHEIAARPVEADLLVDFGLAMEIYHMGQDRDPWPGRDYEGTSVLAGIQAAVELGWYTGYKWAFGLRDVVMTIAYKGPVVLGIPWLGDMFDPDDKGVIHYSGGYAGGHAILANRSMCYWPPSIRGVSRTFENLDRDASMVGLHNSWGRDWGTEGECLISLRDLDLALRQGGEACVPVGRKVAA